MTTITIARPRTCSAIARPLRSRRLPIPPSAAPPQPILTGRLSRQLASPAAEAVHNESAVQRDTPCKEHAGHPRGRPRQHVAQPLRRPCPLLHPQSGVAHRQCRQHRHRRSTRWRRHPPGTGALPGAGHRPADRPLQPHAQQPAQRHRQQRRRYAAGNPPRGDLRSRGGGTQAASRDQPAPGQRDHRGRGRPARPARPAPRRAGSRAARQRSAARRGADARLPLLYR